MNMAGNKIKNGVDTQALSQTITQIKENPSLGQCEFRLRNQWVDGDENRSEVHGYYAAGDEQAHKQVFHFQAGEPTLLAGKDQGANPVEFLLSGLAACMTTTIAYYSALHGYNIKKMHSSLKGELDLQGLFNLNPNVRPGFQNIQVIFTVDTDAPIEKLKEYYKFSPVYDVVSKSVPVEVIFEKG